MQLKTLTRLSAAVAVVFGVVGGALMVLAPAGALAKDAVVLKEAGEFVYDYELIVGNNPGGNVDSSTAYNTDTCSAAGCDVIPLEISEPPTAEQGEFFVTVTLEWDTQEIQGVPVLGEYSVNDLDMYVQNDPVVDGAGPDEDGFTYKSAGTAQPEQVNMYAPVGKWNIFVVNATGANSGYRLKFKVITDDIPGGIFESLPPAFSGGAIPPPRSTPTTLPMPTFEAPAPPTPDIAPAAPPVADASFDTAGTGQSLEDQLAAPPTATFQPAAATRPSAPSTIALLLWMVAFPMALLALSGGFLLRRQRSLVAI